MTAGSEQADKKEAVPGRRNDLLPAAGLHPARRLPVCKRGL
ncbi:hypothetical protein [Bacillus infantis]